MAWKPKKELQERNRKIKKEFKNGATREELAEKYKLSVVSIGNIIREGKEVKSHEDRVNNYVPVDLKPGQVVKLKVGETKAIRTVKYKVIKNYPNYVLMERLGMMECFLHFDIWRGVVCGEVLN